MKLEEKMECVRYLKEEIQRIKRYLENDIYKLAPDRKEMIRKLKGLKFNLKDFKNE